MQARFYLYMCSGLLVTGCVAAPPAPSNTVVICDGRGCMDAPLDMETAELNGISREEKEYIAELERIGEQDPRAAYDLGLRYFRGDDVTQNSYKALVWMRKAAERGNLRAQKALGNFYLTGLEEMGPDPQEAEKWLSIAASKGDRESKILLEEARDAKQSEADYRAWQDRKRSVFYGYWHSGYHYLGAWRNGVWFFD